jgi:hypothetical protein
MLWVASIFIRAKGSFTFKINARFWILTKTYEPKIEVSNEVA